MSKILVSGGLVPTTKDTLLDARTRVATFADIANIENPARFMVITVEDTGKKYEVRKLSSKIIGGIVVENSTIDITDPEALVDLGLAEELRSEDEKVRQSNESKRIEAENLRKSAEDSRKVNETNRVSAEGVREASERTRVSSEETRNANEQTRNSNESKRQSQESTRQSQESARQNNESVRNTNESARKEAESERKTEETSRRTAELSRSSAENTRVKNEQNRTTAENTRSSAEDRRVANETQRTTNETARNNAELSREQAEGNRASTFNTLKGQMQTTIQEGQTAVAATEKATSDAQKVVDEYDTKVAEQDSKLSELGSLLKEGDTDTDVLYIADSQGNVIAKFGKDGITTTDVKLKDQDGLVRWLKKLSESKLLTVDEADKLLSISSIMWSLYNDALYITDGQGNVIFQITDEGVVFKSKEKKTWMQGKVMMSLCDSLGTAGVWQETIAKNTGMEFDKKLNYNGDNDIAFSVGGSQTATHPNGGFDRAIRLVDYVNGGGKCDVLFLENINDMTLVNLNKSKEDVDAMVTTEQPFFCEQYKFIDTPATDYGSAGVYFYENLSSCLSGITPKKGTTIYIGYGRSGKKITITNGASNSGSFAITVGGKTYNISVDSGDTISDIIEKVLEIDYANPNYTDTEVNGENAILFMPTDAEETASLTFDANGTGVAATITSVDSKSYRAESYNSLDTTSSAWLTSSNWGELWSHNLVQIMKGLIEYLSSNLPSTQLYWFIPTRFTGTTPTTKRADGSIDFDAYKANDMRYDMCAYIQKKVCEYYSIPVIDLHNEGGINIYNQLSYYKVNGGVHPPYSTYEYWGNKATKFIV